MTKNNDLREKSADHILQNYLPVPQRKECQTGFYRHEGEEMMTDFSVNYPFRKILSDNTIITKGLKLRGF